MGRPSVDGVLLEWGALLYEPRLRRVAGARAPQWSPASSSGTRAGQAAEIRRCIAATVRRAPQVMVKITGGGRGMRFIRAHFDYISKKGRLDIEDEQGLLSQGRDGIEALADDWQVAGRYLPEVSRRKEAFHITLSMPAGTDAQRLQQAARAFAEHEFADHKHVRVFHGHQANPHVHLVVRAESRHGERLNPRKADLQRWREQFARALRDRGIDAQATRQVTHGALREDRPIWRRPDDADGLQRSARSGVRAELSRQALQAWGQVHNALARSADPDDQALAQQVKRYLMEAPATRALVAEALDPGRRREAGQAGRDAGAGLSHGVGGCQTV